MHKNPLAIKMHTATSKSLACVALFAALLASSCQTFDTINSIAGTFGGNINANNANVNDNTNNANDNYAYDTTDENHNHMSDKFETAKDQGGISLRNIMQDVSMGFVTAFWITNARRDANRIISA